MHKERVANMAECSYICCVFCLTLSVLQSSPVSRVPTRVSATPEKCTKNTYTRRHKTCTLASKHTNIHIPWHKYMKTCIHEGTKYE